MILNVFRKIRNVLFYVIEGVKLRNRNIMGILKYLLFIYVIYF